MPLPRRPLPLSEETLDLQQTGEGRLLPLEGGFRAPGGHLQGGNETIMSALRKDVFKAEKCDGDVDGEIDGSEHLCWSPG